MLLKLAMRNVRRSARDYGVYFVTMVFAVALFYAFNSIESQQALFDLSNQAPALMFSAIGSIMDLISVVITVVLAFLMVYANRFLIRRRKREFGTYLLLGMTPGQVSRIVLAETGLVGLVSLAVGLAAGFLISQGLSIASAAMFAMRLEGYRFVFSPNACIMTAACFGLMYVLCALVNVGQVRRCRLATLLGAERAEEVPAVRGGAVSAVGFIAALGILAVGYFELGQNGLFKISPDATEFWIATACMIVGTFVLFWSLAGFVIALVRRTRGIYYRGLCMFTVAQVANKVNTAFVSLWAICVMLFFAIAIFSCGLGLVNVISADLNKQTAFDATVSSFPQNMVENHPELRATYERSGGNTAELIAKTSSAWDQLVDKIAQVDLYELHTMTYEQVCERVDVALTDSAAQRMNDAGTAVEVVAVSQYNRACEMTGGAQVQLEPGTFAVDVGTLAPAGFADACRARGSEAFDVTVGEMHLTTNGDVFEQPLFTSGGFAIVLVVPDEAIDSLKADTASSVALPYATYVNANFKAGISETEADRLLEQTTTDVRRAVAVQAGEMSAASNEAPPAYMWPAFYTNTAAGVEALSATMSVIATYLGVYIGLVLLVATAAILAIQQLSEAIDSQRRYRAIARLGAERRDMLGSLRAQVCLYFLAPLAVAACHAGFTFWVLNRTLFNQVGASPMSSILLAAALLVCVYGCYLLVTYYGCKSVVSSALSHRVREA